MTLYRLIGETAPTIRSRDLLTEDHPLRTYPPVEGFRYSAWIRGLSFAGVLVVAMILVASCWIAVTGGITSEGIEISVTAAIVWETLAAVVAYVVLVFAMEGRVWPYELQPRRILGILKGILLGFALVSLCIGVLALLGVYKATGWNGAYSPWSDLLMLGIGAGIAEEIMFRGTLFRLTEEGLGTWGAVVVSAFVFGILHASNPQGTLWGGIAITIEAGLLFAAVYIITRSLWWCIGLHLAWNMTEGPFYGSIVSGAQEQHSWITSTWTGPDIVTGGTFGLEGSIVPVIVLGLLGIALLVYAQRAGLMVAPSWIRKKTLTAEHPGPAL